MKKLPLFSSRLRIIRTIALFCCLSFLAQSAFATSFAVPSTDERTWDEVVVHLQSPVVPGRWYASEDGKRLKELDEPCAAAFLMSLLGTPHRANAMEALGWGVFKEAIPALAAIALDKKAENRVLALNPGLRYMNDQRAIDTAKTLSTDDEPAVREAAYWVLSGHGTDEAVTTLQKRLKEGDAQKTSELIYALNFSKHPRAGDIVFENSRWPKVINDESTLRAYALTMTNYSVVRASDRMLSVMENENSLIRFYALRYFGKFPRQEAAEAILRLATAKKTILRRWRNAGDHQSVFEIAGNRDCHQAAISGLVGNAETSRRN